jgi:hypothetical protein
MATKKCRRAEDVDVLRQSIAHGEALRNRRKALGDKMREADVNGGVFVSEQCSKIDSMARAVLSEVTGEPEQVTAVSRASLEDEIAACDRAIEQWQRRHEAIQRDTAAMLWREDYEQSDFEIRRDIVRALVAAGEGELKLRAHRAAASRVGALPCNANCLPLYNASSCAKLPMALQTLANQLGAFKQTNANLLNGKG